MHALSERTKLSFLCLLLLLMLGILAFTSVSTIQAVKTFQHQATAVNRGDVSTIHSWMTIHVVSHVYNVPEDYLYASLQINVPHKMLRHTTLYQLASRKHQTVNQVIYTLQHAIVVYRYTHPRPATPTPTPERSKKSLASTPGRT